MRDINEILNGIKDKITAACKKVGRDPKEVEIIAVTKTHGPEVVREAWDAGLAIVGENKVQEAMWKKEQAISGPSWHLIGHLQSNKVRHALMTFDFFHSIDSIKLIDKFQSVADEIGLNPHILLEVNVSGERSKSGMRPDDVNEAVRHIAESCPRLTLEGFMTMAPFDTDPEKARPYFRRLREMRDHLEEEFNASFPRLSMGMSGDYEVAIEEGATWIRLGTILFGERPKLQTVRAQPSEDDGMSFRGLDSFCGEGPTYKILD